MLTEWFATFEGTGIFVLGGRNWRMCTESTGGDKDEGPELKKINSPFPDLAQFHITQISRIVMGRRDRAVKVID